MQAREAFWRGPRRATRSTESSLFVARVRYGAEECVLGLARIEPVVLDHYGHVRLDDARVVSVDRYGLGVFEVVEAHVQRERRAGTITW